MIISSDKENVLVNTDRDTFVTMTWAEYHEYEENEGWDMASLVATSRG